MQVTLDIPVAETNIPPINLWAKQLIKRELEEFTGELYIDAGTYILRKTHSRGLNWLLNLPCVTGCQRHHCRIRVMETRFITTRKENYH